MSINKENARKLLSSAELSKLFKEELGWDHLPSALDFTVGVRQVHLLPVAQKRGMAVYLWQAGTGEELPAYGERIKIEGQLAKLAREHLLIFVDTKREKQVWLWVRREPGLPDACRQHSYHRAQSGDALLQKLDAIAFSLDEEEKLTLPEVTRRNRQAFDVERVTKKFYDAFQKQQKDFLKAIVGIDNEEDRSWYASVMLNRLMFAYFLQKKGFLDGQTDYLRQRLDTCKTVLGPDRFHSFYRSFLLRLFHDGLGAPERDAELTRLIGKIPYLNGGLFDVHELERAERYGTTIEIPDESFARVFDFFDQYQWHLDERALKDDKEINPDVLGYIFEKYINQKQMGAYYTKEDITEYIGRNTIVPFILESAKAHCAVAFESGTPASVWNLVQQDPDRYIFPAVRHGVSWDYQPDNIAQGVPLPSGNQLPDEIAAGVDPNQADLLELRKPWNKPAPPEFALPTETWREVVARRTRLDEIRRRMVSGAMTDLNEFITLNLNVRQFAQDMIQNAEGPDLLWAIWRGVSTITVLDPTGGSGAFLFAALNILDRLYEACLDRMEAFRDEWAEVPGAHPNYFKWFDEVLKRIDTHPNRRYFVLKSIILNNLYAVDFMEEAVEICKLRLFLKLAAQVEPDNSKPNQGIEPLPDIDFNIRAGNTLVGYATKKQLEDLKTTNLDFGGDVGTIVSKAAEIQKYADKFRTLQTEGEGTIPHADKVELRHRLEVLNDELDRYLAGEYGVAVVDKTALATWKSSHQPFHWLVQFHGIMAKGGFDVVIGNPPYLDLGQLSGYSPRGYETAKTGNLYSLVLERSEGLAHGRKGFIVPISSTSTEGYLDLQKILTRQKLWFSSFDDRPAHLFDGLDKNTLSILIYHTEMVEAKAMTSPLVRWNTAERGTLFQRLHFGASPRTSIPGCFPRVSSPLEQSIWGKCFARHSRLSQVYSRAGIASVNYSRKVNSFLQVLDFVPNVTDGAGKKRAPSEFKTIFFPNELESRAVFCALNTSLFRWFVDAVSDGSHLNKREIDNFPFDIEATRQYFRELEGLGRRFSDSLKENSFERRMTYKHDTLTVQCIVPKRSKQLGDLIDKVFGEVFNLSPEELDFIINYDIKYRMGRDAEDDDE